MTSVVIEPRHTEEGVRVVAGWPDERVREFAANTVARAEARLHMAEAAVDQIRELLAESALPAPQEPVQAETREAAGVMVTEIYNEDGYWEPLIGEPVRDVERAERYIKAFETKDDLRIWRYIPAPQEPVADVPSGDTVLPELEQYEADVDECMALCAQWMDRKTGWQVALYYKAKYEAAQRESSELRLALSLNCELHGCGSKACTAAAYHGDAIELIRSHEAAHQALPWLPQPDSEGWWWHKNGTSVLAREVKSLLGPDDELRALYVPELGDYADYCTGQWQQIPTPTPPEAPVVLP